MLCKRTECERERSSEEWVTFLSTKFFFFGRSSTVRTSRKKLSSLLLLSFHLNKNVRKSAHGTTTGKGIFAYLRFCFWNWFVWSSSFMKKKNIKNRKSSIEWVHNWDKRKKLKRQNRTNGNHCCFVMRATKKNFRITACVVNWQKSLHHLSKTWERKKCLHIFLCLSFI